MRLSWNEVRVRAAAFADKWREAAYEKGETQSFYNDFFQIFGVSSAAPWRAMRRTWRSWTIGEGSSTCSGPAS